MRAMSEEFQLQASTKRKYIKKKCGARIASGFPDGSFHVCYLPQGHKGKHRCGHSMGMPHKEPQECGFKWGGKKPAQSGEQLDLIALEALQEAKDKRREILDKQERESMAFDLVPVIEGDAPDRDGVYLCVHVQTNVYAKIIIGIESLDDLKGWGKPYKMEARK